MKIGNAMLAGLAALLLSVSVQAGVADRIVAVVNNEVITLTELNGVFEPYRERFAATYRGTDREGALKEAMGQLLNRMVDNLLMEQESRKTGITVRNEEVTEAIRDLQRQRNITPEQFTKALEQEGTGVEEYRKDVRDQLMRLKLIRRDIKAKVAVTDEEIGEYYRRHREEYEGKEAVRIRQIMLPLPRNATREATERLRAEGESIRTRLKNGEPFELLSARYSQGPSAAEGGDIGYVEKGMILPEMEEVAFSLPLHAISELIETSSGFHILQVTDRKGAGLKPIEEVREEIRARIDREKMEKRFDAWLAELRNRSHIEIRL